MGLKGSNVQAIEWAGDRLRLLDQRLLPTTEDYFIAVTVSDVQRAIQGMVVRGAPAIGITAAYGVVLAAISRIREVPETWQERVREDLKILAHARPTAINLMWALGRMEARLEALAGDPVASLLEEAKTIHQQDIEANQRMGELGAALLGTDCRVLTHCNTGSLATGGFGTALGVIRQAWAAGDIARIFADETRPWLQGSRLTAWELMQDGIPVTLIAEGAAAHLMRVGRLDWVIVGADRIAANGDAANKIGTYSLAVAARYHGVRFMVVAPTSTVDFNTLQGADIPIEIRDASELLQVAGKPCAPAGADAWNPGFDITPAELIDVIVTERGVVENPCEKGMARLNDDGTVI